MISEVGRNQTTQGLGSQKSFYCVKGSDAVTLSDFCSERSGGMPARDSEQCPPPGVQKSPKPGL